MNAVTDFKSIKRIVDRQEQKAEFDAKNPPPPAWYSMSVCWPADADVPYVAPDSDPA